ncbi:cytochrome-c peroxidase [Sneathiella sp.]|jgi:cytochrome c peroxidase|uniref:cytochrome-c peroxidase n=1 Tax=Sneathiella sp. TaxID=1964365 RepID=UPI0039E6EF97
MTKRFWILICSSAILVGGLVLYVFTRESVRVSATPITNFSAPFVFGRFNIPKENPLTEEAFALGRRLFYDPILSGNNDVACATCHQQHLAFTDGLARPTGLSGKELEFSSMSLANLLWGARRFFWNGRAVSLEELALIPIQHPEEMNQNLDELLRELKKSEKYRYMFAQTFGDISSDAVAKALATFMRLLISSDSKYDQFLRGEVNLSPLEEHGRKLFMAHPDVKASLRGANCIDCHSQFLTSGFRDAFDGFSNNGLDSEEHLSKGLEAVTKDPKHRGLFKVPTLRNIALTAPYMHDGRFRTLEEVMDHYINGIKISTTLSPLILEADNSPSDNDPSVGLKLNDSEKKAIIAFLHTLTDEKFVSNQKLSNPFEGGS